MSINLQRADRKTEHFIIPTPNNIGPGAYDPKKATSKGLDARENVAPFNSMKDRIDEAENGNPGQYLHFNQK